MFSLCASCQEILEVSFTGQQTHPGCPQTETETLARQFVDAIQRGDEPEAQRLEALVNRVDEPPSLGSAALWYATHAGWPVFPLAPGSKLPAIPSAHPLGDPLRGVCKGECGKLGHGLYDATVEPDLIRQWWSQADYNIGVPTGPVSGFDAIDVDGPIGVRSLAELGDDVLPDIHGKVSTPRGVHLLVLATESGNRAGVRPGIDYRSIGGFVVASPSVVDGKRYSWLMKPSPEILGTVKV